MMVRNTKQAPSNSYLGKYINKEVVDVYLLGFLSIWMILTRI